MYCSISHIREIMAANRVEYHAIASNIKERLNDSAEGQTTALWKEKLKITETAPKVIVIPAKPELTKQRTI